MLQRDGNRRRAEVLLVHPPWMRLMGSNLIPFPTGPCHVAALLERAGVDALVWNGDYDHSPVASLGGTNILRSRELMEAHTRYLRRLEDPADAIWSEIDGVLEIVQPKVVGISAYSASFQSACRIAERVRLWAPDVPVVLGGLHGTIDPEGCLDACTDIDLVALGEVELSAEAIFRRLLDPGRKREFDDLPGVAFRRGAEKVRTPHPGRVDDLDGLPLPARHRLIDLDEMPPMAHQAIYSYRGCPFGCIFCASHNMFGRTPRLRSAQSIVDEMEMVHKTYGTTYYYICDDLFLWDRNRVVDFCRLLEERRLPVSYSLQTRGEMLDESLLPGLKRSGAQHIAIGVEVGDEDVRKRIRKGNTVEDMREAGRKLRRHGLRMSGFFMFGFPWESRREMLATVELMEELDPIAAFAYIVTPAPGTELLSLAKEMHLIPEGLPLASFSHTSPRMALSSLVPEEEKEPLLNEILERFSRHNRKAFLRDLPKRPRFYLSTLRDAGILASPSSFFRYLKLLVFG